MTLDLPATSIPLGHERGLEVNLEGVSVKAKSRRQTFLRPKVHTETPTLVSLHAGMHILIMPAEVSGEEGGLHGSNAEGLPGVTEVVHESRRGCKVLCVYTMH